MKANIINGKIEIFSILPDVWKNHLNFKKASKELLISEGFYDIVIPIYDNNTEYIDNLHFDDKNLQFTYDVFTITQAQIDYNIAINNWHHKNFKKRITVPSIISTLYPEIYTNIGIHMMINKLPIETSDDENTFYLYMNTIKSEHQQLVDNLGEFISIEDIPII